MPESQTATLYYNYRLNTLVNHYREGDVRNKMLLKSNLLRRVNLKLHMQNKEVLDKKAKFRSSEIQIPTRVSIIHIIKH